jgi:predicted Zn-dependent protease
MIVQIAHELGHALGLGKANFNGDVMSPAINDQSRQLSQCDINAVNEANQILITSNADEHHIKGDLYNCV